MSEPDEKMIEQMSLKIREIMLEQKGESDELLPVYNPELPIAELVCRGLTVFMCRVIRYMAEHKKMDWTSNTKVKKERDPKKGTKVVITADDFYHMMKDYEDLILPQPIYNSFMKSLNSRIVMKDLSEIRHMFQKAVALETKRICQTKRKLKSLKMKEDDEGEKNKTTEHMMTDKEL